MHSMSDEPQKGDKWLVVINDPSNQLPWFAHLSLVEATFVADFRGAWKVDNPHTSSYELLDDHWIIPLKRMR